MSFHKRLKFFSEMCPQYMNLIYKASNQNKIVTKNSSLKFFQLVRTKTMTQKYVCRIQSLKFGMVFQMMRNCQTMRIRLSIRSKRASWYYYKKKIKLSMYTICKLPPSLPHFNHGTIMRTEIAYILCFNTTIFPLCKYLVLF